MSQDFISFLRVLKQVNKLTEQESRASSVKLLKGINLFESEDVVMDVLVSVVKKFFSDGFGEGKKSGYLFAFFEVGEEVGLKLHLGDKHDLTG